MYLFEHEAKDLLVGAGIPVPERLTLWGSGDQVPGSGVGLDAFLERTVMVKAQVLAGGRGKAGLVRRAAAGELSEVVRVIRGLRPDVTLLVEEVLSIQEEWYVSVVYDTAERRPVLMWSEQGGMDVEGQARVNRLPLDPSATVQHLDDVSTELRIVAEQLIAYFFANDARLIEINPLIKTTDGRLVAADAKITLDDDAAFRHPEWAAYPERSVLGRAATERERAAREIDSGAQGYRGTASKYIEMDGDIAVLFSGGGASITCMDALAAAGGKPANYSEYSGNPPREKVQALTRIALSKPGLRGLWIAGGVANFTDIGETLGAIADVLREVKPSYPIVVRRAGPGAGVGRAALEAVAAECNLKLRFFGAETPMTETAQVLMDLVRGGRKFSARTS